VDNIGFVVAAYVVTFTFVTVYTVRITLRLGRARAAATAKQGDS